MDCWNKYWAWTKTDEFKREMRKIVLADDFLDDNFLSNDVRVPVTLLETNACSPLATNAIAGVTEVSFSRRETPATASTDADTIASSHFTAQAWDRALASASSESGESARVACTHP